MPPTPTTPTRRLVLTDGLSVVTAAGLDRPDGFHSSFANSDAVAVQVHRRAAVRGYHLTIVSDLDALGLRFHAGVLLRQLEHALGRPVLDHRRAEVAGDRLAAGIEDVLARPAADHRGQDRQRTAELRPDG